MAAHSCSLHTPSYLDEIATLRRLVEAGDRAHALRHCTSALGLEPQRSEWRAPLLDLLSDRQLLAGLEEEQFYAAHAARAYHLHEVGQLEAAIALVAEVHAAVPHVGFLPWMTAWVDEAVAKGIALDPRPLLTVLMLGFSFGVGRMRLLPAEIAAAEELVPIARTAMKVTNEGRIAVLASAILRRATRWDEAVQAAERASASPELVYVAKGLALRGARDFEGALRTFEEAFRATSDVIHVSEQVRIYADAGRWAEAIAAWKRVAEVRPADGENLAELAAIEEGARTNAPPPEVPPLDEVRRRVLGHGHLFGMTDATANILRQVGGAESLRAKGATGAGEAIRSGKVKVAVSGREGPTNRLALALMLTGEADPRRAPYENASSKLYVVAPGEDAFTLWREEGDVVVQALAPPPSQVSDWIEALALPESDGSVAEFESTPDFLALWERAAKQAPPKARARDWAAAIVHPRVPVNRATTTAEWVFRWQVVALLGLVASEPGWAGTEKREAMLSVLRGAVDWSLAAAIRVAAEVALREPETTRELRLALLDIRPALKGEPNHAIAESLILALEMLPYVSKTFLEPLRALIAEAADDAQEEPEPPPPPAASRPWWKFWGPS